MGKVEEESRSWCCLGSSSSGVLYRILSTAHKVDQADYIWKTYSAGTTHTLVLLFFHHWHAEYDLVLLKVNCSPWDGRGIEIDCEPTKSTCLVVKSTSHTMAFAIKLTANEMLTSWLMSVCSIPLVSRNRSHFVTLFLVPGNPNDNETFIGQLYRMGQVPSKGKDY